MIPVKYKRNVVADKVTNQVLVAWGDSFGDSNKSEQTKDVSMIVMEDDVRIFDSYFPLMVDLDSDENDHVTLQDIKDNLKDYYSKRLKFLAAMLIDIVNELTKDKESLKEDLDKCVEEMIELSVQVTKLQETS